MTVFNPSSHKFAIACGTGGAFVEVTSSVVFNEGAVTRSWGRKDAFSDASPANFAFTLDNRDGKFTPGFVTGIAPVVLPLAKGMGVSWELNGQIRSGRIRSVVPIFPPEGRPDAARVRVTVDDVLAVAARTSIETVVAGMVDATRPLAYWALDDPAGSDRAAETSGSNRPTLDKFYPDATGSKVEFGVAGVAEMGTTAAQVTVPTNGGPIIYTVGLRSSPMTFIYPTDTDFGWWGAWIERGMVYTPEGNYGVGDTRMTINFGTDRFVIGITYDGRIAYGWDTGTLNTTFSISNRDMHYFAVRFTRPTAGSPSIRATPVYMGSTLSSVTSSSFTISNTKTVVTTLEAANVPGEQGFKARFSQFTHSMLRVPLDIGVGTTAATRLTALAAAVPQLTLDTLPTDLTLSPIGEQGSGSVLDLMNEIIRGEQGHIYSVSSGTLLAPVERVRVKSRTRPDAVTATFTVTDDVMGAPDMGYETTNTVSAATATGPTTKVTAQNPALEDLVGSANTSVQLALVDPVDLRAFADDRILRGVSTSVDVLSVVVNARSTTASRWSDMLNMTPGLRYRISGLPTTQLGFSFWDGWFLGADELHDQENNSFTLHFERTLPPAGIYDTSRYMAGGALSLSSAINSSVTSMSVATNDANVKLHTGADLPYVVLVDAEQINVTAVTSATPQVATVTRGFNGTTAAAHSAAALVEMADFAPYAY